MAAAAAAADMAVAAAGEETKGVAEGTAVAGETILVWSRELTKDCEHGVSSGL